VLEEAILAVQEVAHILTQVIMVNPLAALGVTGQLGVDLDDNKDS